MTKVNVKLTSFYGKAKDNFEFYVRELRINGTPTPSMVDYTDLNKLAFDVLFEVDYKKLDNPEYEVNVFKGEDYLGNFKVRYCKKPTEDEKKELIKNLKSKELHKRAKSLAEFCLKRKMTSEEE
jgi:hypothetical protein